MQIEKLSVDKIKVYPNNAKLHPAYQIEQIKKSIQMYGNNDPIAVWGKDNVIVEGHGRFIALTELGYDEVEVIHLDHLTDEQRRQYMLVHNQTTMNSGWDEDLLQIELEDIGIDMSEFGFDIMEQDDDGDDQTPSDDTGFNYKEQYGVIVMCADEAEQEQVYNRLIGEGYECKVVAT